MFAGGNPSGNDREQHGSDCVDGAHPLRQTRRQAEHQQARRPQRDAATERWHARIQSCRSTGDEQAFAERKDQEPGGGKVVAAAEESHREQRGRDDDANAVDGPENLAQRVAGDKRATDAERGPEVQADDGNDVVTSLLRHGARTLSRH